MQETIKQIIQQIKVKQGKTSAKDLPQNVEQIKVSLCLLYVRKKCTRKNSGKPKQMCTARAAELSGPVCVVVVNFAGCISVSSNWPHGIARQRWADSVKRSKRSKTNTLFLFTRHYSGSGARVAIHQLQKSSPISSGPQLQANNSSEMVRIPLWRMPLALHCNETYRAFARRVRCSTSKACCR